VALKIVKGPINKKLQKEVSLMRSFHHPNIVQLLDVICDIDWTCLAMEYVSGGDLLMYLQHGERFADEEALMIFEQIVLAVDYLHSQHSVFHGDLKLDNILLDESFRVKLIDFGFSDLVNMNGLVENSCGSVEYSAPELLNGEPRIGLEGDIWALGVILYAILTGCFPFGGETVCEVMKSQLEGRFETPPDCSESCVNLISIMLEPNRFKRATIEGVLLHPWLNRDGKYVVRRAPLEKEQVQMGIVDRLRYLEFDSREVIRNLTSENGLTRQSTILYHYICQQEKPEKKVNNRNSLRCSAEHTPDNISQTNVIKA